jgi:bifunctional polynucleotide phosphatase/kinase
MSQASPGISPFHLERATSLRASSSGPSKKRVADCQTDDTSAKKAKRECAQSIALDYAFTDSACSVHPFFSKESDKPSRPTEFKWIKGPNKTLLHGTNLNPKCSTKVAAFDLDGTVILGSFWSKETEGQWKWWNPAVPSRLKALHDDG